MRPISPESGHVQSSSLTSFVRRPPSLCVFISVRWRPRYFNPFHTPRSLLHCSTCLRSTRMQKCGFSVLRLVPVSLMAPIFVVRPCSRANSMICSGSSGSAANTDLSRSIFSFRRPKKVSRKTSSLLSYSFLGTKTVVLLRHLAP